MEMHITHTVSQSAVAGCPAAGCLVVVGALFELAEEGEVADSITELAARCSIGLQPRTC